MSVKPRKSAKQERSRGTIDALLEATARIVSQVGLDDATTNRIAEVAGVSIGSLYQYFPGKASLLAALIEREARGDLAAMRVVFDEVRALPLEQAVARLVRELVSRHARNPALYRWMLRYVPELGQHGKVRQVAAEGRTLLRDWLASRKAELAPEIEPALAALVLGSAVEAAVHTALFESPETLEDGTLQRALARACQLYLLGPAS
jgi:AcrR family transcriptional regulator